MGIQIKRRWVCTKDSRTRLSHGLADGQIIVGTKKPFIVGGYKMMFPGDKSLGAPGHEINNCRCTTRIVEKDGIEAEPRQMRVRNADGEWEVVNEMTYSEWKKWKKGLENSDNGAIIKAERAMANGARKSYLIRLSEKDKQFILKEIDAIGADRNVFVFRDGQPTVYVDSRDKIFVSSSIFPSEDNSTHPTDMLSVRATLAHEYYGHRAHRNTTVKEGAWNDEFRASYLAAKNCPGLTDRDRALLINDAMQRAKDAGVSIRLNSFMRRCLYGIE